MTELYFESLAKLSPSCRESVERIEAMLRPMWQQDNEFHTQERGE